MKFIIVAALALVALASAAPVEPEVNIVRSSFDQQPEGAYVASFETSDGTKREESGDLKEALDEENKPHTVVVVRGSYEFVDKEGVKHSLTYVADENGYQPQSEDIPVGPAPVRR